MENLVYVSKEWIEKRNQILGRDNYTCQNCNTFNPSLGSVALDNPKDSSLEIHFYSSTPNSSVYTISSAKHNINVEIDFGNNWLVLPILQVHHKRYIENRYAWDYESSDLITLCKKCHTNLHNNIEIPLCDNNGSLIDKKKFLPKDQGSGRNHNFDSWTFIHYNNGKEYELGTLINPSLGIFVLDEDYAQIEEIKEIAKEISDDFFERFLPRYYK